MTDSDIAIIKVAMLRTSAGMQMDGVVLVEPAERCRVIGSAIVAACKSDPGYRARVVASGVTQRLAADARDRLGIDPATMPSLIRTVSPVSQRERSTRD